jgi:hypothetical protein
MYQGVLAAAEHRSDRSAREAFERLLPGVVSAYQCRPLYTVVVPYPTIFGTMECSPAVLGDVI